MNNLYVCKSCGKVMKKAEDFANEVFGSEYCKECTDEFGYMKRYSQVIKEIKLKLINQMSLSEEEAEKMAMENISQIPHWAQRQNLISSIKNIIITDVGSTTTKALLLQKKGEEFKLKSLHDSPTTVEKPLEDVNIGVFNAIKFIEQETGIPLLTKNSNDSEITFNEDTLYLTTSSAGGGLQILVIGLTLFDSASSGKRTAFGAGGVILDTFAIDDKRSSLEQMQAMSVLHPDIILMCGGIDGGAVSPILRLGEILQLANPSPKFGDKTNIPLVFAGNIEARTFIAGLFGKRFDLFMVPNLRPKLTEENLQPAREKIHQLFMDNVMEQAPGYSSLKKIVSDDIIPTPMSVISSLQLISEKLDENVMAVDIGGATTDIFSNILGEYFRTVSANYGMSYSISNVLKDTGYSNIKKWLPEELNDKYITNYIANKMLYPTFNPSAIPQIAIEHAVSKEAIRMSKKQHMKMNFNTKEIGFLDKLKAKQHDLENITEAFYIEKAKDAKKFHMYDINILIGAGGVLSHTDSNEQALSIIYNGFQPEGITEIWKDKHFISPHLGKLSAVDEKLATKLLTDECFERIGLTIRPLAQKWKLSKTVLTIEVESTQHIIKVGDRLYLSNEKGMDRVVTITLEKGIYLNEQGRGLKFTTDLPIYIDALQEDNFDSENQALQLFPRFKEIPAIEESFKSFIKQKQIITGTQEHKVSLPYEGNIFVKPDDEVTSDTIIGENLFDPPRVYVISLFDKTYLHLDSTNIEKSLQIKEGDEVKFGQRIVEIGDRSFIKELQFQHFYFDSPVRGNVEKINLDSGTIIMREIQDYSTKPRKINIAKRLNVLPKQIKAYMKKSEGDFVYAGDTLASRVFDKNTALPSIVSSPTTGTIKDVNLKTGIVTVQYDKEPYQLKAGITGKVKRIVEKTSAIISYSGLTLKGIIGFGAEANGKLKYIESISEIENCSNDDILVFTQKIDNEILNMAIIQKINGIIAPSIDSIDLVQFIGKEIGVALTGNEDIPFPLIITEGFGNFEMNDGYQKTFSENNGKDIYINGHTQIRAGVTRPKIIVMDS
ncbi:MAG: glutamate mutase L [Candidatus Tenebribacter burtonii]|nr:glutamate mutase L [Candidatus Tenebribacter burtonii]